MKLRVAVPTHSRTLSTATTETLLRLQRALLQRGDEMEANFFSGAIISDIRNAIVADFLQSDAETLIMLDADMGLGSASVLRMIDFGRPFVGCMYPRRSFDWSRVQASEGDIGRSLYQAMEFVGMIERPEGDTSLRLEQGFARAVQVGAGLLVLRREVFERLARDWPDLSGRGFSAKAYPGPRFHQNWGFFNPLPVSGGPNLPEDFSFCHRWRTGGGDIWADVNSRIAHVGQQDFTGSFLDYLQANAP